MERAGLSDAFVTGTATRIRAVRVRPMTTGAYCTVARLSVTPRITPTNTAVAMVSMSSAASSPNSVPPCDAVERDEKSP